MDETLGEMFNIIRETYVDFDNELRNKFLFVVRDTEKGIWGPSDMDNVFELFKQIKLNKHKKFLDIGCGDGRVASIASLFTDAVGIEFDKELVNKADEIKDKLALSNVHYICADFYKHDFSDFDIIFINPDTGFYNGLEEKLMKELKGILLVYNNIFLPRILKRGKTYWMNQTPVIVFTNHMAVFTD